MSSSKFDFLNDVPSEFRVEVIRVPSDIGSKDELMRFFASALRFPDYFGHNWDALLDCLSDLSWIEAALVLLIHDALPRMPPADLRTYIEVLNDAVERTQSTLPGLKIYFPALTRKDIAALVG